MDINIFVLVTVIICSVQSLLNKEDSHTYRLRLCCGAAILAILLACRFFASEWWISSLN